MSAGIVEYCARLISIKAFWFQVVVRIVSYQPLAGMAEKPE